MNGGNGIGAVRGDLGRHLFWVLRRTNASGSTRSLLARRMALPFTLQMLEQVSTVEFVVGP
jgi:hypothetical protein